MVLADSLVAFTTIFLAILFFIDAIEIWHILTVMFIRALAGCFHSNAMHASTSLMVPKEYLTRIQGLNQMLSGGLNIVAAPLGALLLAVLPMQGILAIDVVTAFIAVTPLMFLTIPQPEMTDDQESQTVWQDFKEGLRYVAAWPGLIMMGFATIAINLTIIPAFSLLPLLVKTYFGGGAVELSWIEAAMGIGIFMGGALLGVWGGFKRKVLTTLLGLSGMGVSVLTIAFAPGTAIWLAVSGSLVLGIMTSLTMGPFYAIIQTIVEPDMQARVLSLLSSVGTAMVPLGLMIAGPVSDRIGIHTWFFAGGILCIVIGFSGLFIPQVMNIENRRSEIIQMQNTKISVSAS